ncbi:hypothetical protein GC176_24085 [bacterium]|nr:hypothetical protein [bacterium]
MARNESDREDLIREAQGLPDRAEWQVPGEADPVVTGVKRNGSLCLYLGADPVYQFDQEGRLRRAYVAGFLYRTQGDTLARIYRERTETETTLVRHDLDTGELDAFLTSMTNRLQVLRDELANGRATLLRSVERDPLAGLPDFLTLIDETLDAAPVLAPAIPGRDI